MTASPPSSMAHAVLAAPIPLPNKTWLTLYEAVTALVYGNCADREAIGFEYPSVTQYRDQWKSVLAICWEEATQNKKLAGFLTFMNDWHKDHSRQVFMKLHQCRSAWPPSINSLRRLWIDWIKARCAEENREREGGRLLLKAVLAGDVLISGKQGGLPDARVENIRAEELDVQYKVAWTINELNPRNQQRHSNDHGHAWKSVSVERASLERWWLTMCGLLPSEQKAKGRGGASARGIASAILAEFPRGIPDNIRAKDRNNRIRSQLTSMGLQVPMEEATLSKAIQRAIRASTQPTKDN